MPDPKRPTMMEMVVLCGIASDLERVGDDISEAKLLEGIHRFRDANVKGWKGTNWSDVAIHNALGRLARRGLIDIRITVTPAGRVSAASWKERFDG